MAVPWSPSHRCGHSSSAGTRKQVKDTADVVDKAALAVQGVELSAFAKEADPERRYLNLHRVLFEYARRLRKAAHKASLRNPIDRDLLRASIVRHVTHATQTTAGRRHDREVSTLIDAAMTPPKTIFDNDPQVEDWEPYSTEAHAKWCTDHRELLAEPIRLERAWEKRLRQRVNEAKQIRRERAAHPPIRRHQVTTALHAARALHPAVFGRRTAPTAV